MSYLRTVSTRRLLALIASVVAVIAAGTAIAVASGGAGPKPPAKPLAQAIHGALSAPSVQGLTARISFTNHLIGSSNIQGSDPILTGATGRLWLSNDGRMRLELQSDNGDAQVVVSNGTFWIYDPSAHTAYEGKLPTGAHEAKQTTEASKHDGIPTVAQIQKHITDLIQHANLSGAIPSDVAGRAAYTVRVSPKHDGGLLGSAELAWDAARGVPLKFAIYARGQHSPVLQLRATNISYGKVPASDFKASPPADAKVVKINMPAAASHKSAAGKHSHARRDVTGAAAVAKHLAFGLVAPKTLDGLPRQSVSLLDWGGTPAALVTYGQNLGGIAVIEQVSKPGQAAAGSGGDHHGLSLPTVSINGATGQELDTALGTVVRFSRGGVAYTVLGSVPAAAADAAARAL
jgi:outer membrane lipoprotein-sorting protein